MRENNSKWLRRQRQLDTRAIIGNPPYSADQHSANDLDAN